MYADSYIPTPRPVAQHTHPVALPNLDGIRAVACLLVVVSHVPWPGKPAALGAVGVALFFVLSGFLMSYLYARSSWTLAAAGRYAIARFSRIAPIYWLVVSLCIAISYLEPHTDFSMRIQGVQQITRHYLFGGSGYVFWSIPPEVQYYLFFPLLWWSMARQAQHAWALPLLAVLSAALLLTHTLWPGLALPHKLHFFLAGSLAGLMPRHRWDRPPDRTALTLLQIGALVLVMAPLWLYASQATMYDATELGLVFALGIYLLSLNSGWTRGVFASRWMRAIGHASFSIYLMHALVFHFGMRLLDLDPDAFQPGWLPLMVLAVVLPMVASRYIEIPLQKTTRQGLSRLFRLR
jgi:peptidoglycan/LPS O-acetylase OafA/YrhL